jgi:hypothetical protein
MSPDARSASQPVVADAGDCRAIGLAAWEAYSAAVDGLGTAFERMWNPEPGDLVLEVTTAFRWLRIAGLAPGEALGWLLRVEGDEYVVRPIYQADGEFRWANAKMIRVDPSLLPQGQNDERED